MNQLNPQHRPDPMAQEIGTLDSWWESLIFRSMLGVVLIPAWFVLMNLFTNTSHIRYRDTSAFDVYMWCIVGMVGFALFAWAALARTQAGKPYLPGWSLTLLALFCAAQLALMLALSDPGFLESLSNGAAGDFYSSHLYPWAAHLQVPVTLGITIGVGLYRLIPNAKWLWATLTLLFATVPFIVFAAFLLDYRDLI